MRNCCVSAQIRGMCGHATTLRLFPEAIDKTAAKRSGGRSPRGRLGRILRKATDFGLAQYLLPLANLSTDVLIGRFKQLENNMERLRPYMTETLY